MTRARTKRNRKERRARKAAIRIHTLPFEIVARIFELALDAHTCYYDTSRSPEISMKSPETLSRVCSRWRQIALDTHTLWPHIDLAPFQSLNRFKGLLARGEVFAARAGNLPLNIHVLGGKKQGRPHDADLDLDTFCALVAARIGSLELLATDWHDHGYRSILEKCFARCVPGTLRQLVTTGGLDTSYHGFGFIGTLDDPMGSKDTLLKVSKQCLEDLLLPVKVLHLNDLYLPWTSKAYHGLVDLHLTSQSSPPQSSISQLQLATILAASPGLRLFRFGLKITDVIPDGNLGSPVVLNDLEVFSLGPLSYAQHNGVLQIISPGSKPLRVLIHFNKETLPPLPSDEFARFMTHSKLTELSIKFDGDGHMALRWLPQLLRVTPSLKTLFLTGFDLLPNHLHPLEYDASKVEIDKLRPIGSGLDYLVLAGCRIIMDEFRRLTKIFPIQKLELEGCSIYSMYLFEFDSNELAEIFPDFQFTGDPKPINADYWREWFKRVGKRLQPRT